MEGRTGVGRWSGGGGEGGVRRGLEGSGGGTTRGVQGSHRCTPRLESPVPWRVPGRRPSPPRSEVSGEGSWANSPGTVGSNGLPAPTTAYPTRPDTTVGPSGHTAHPIRPSTPGPMSYRSFVRTLRTTSTPLTPGLSLSYAGSGTAGLRPGPEAEGCPVHRPPPSLGCGVRPPAHAWKTFGGSSQESGGGGSSPIPQPTTGWEETFGPPDLDSNYLQDVGHRGDYWIPPTRVPDPLLAKKKASPTPNVCFRRHQVLVS